MPVDVEFHLVYRTAPDTEETKAPITRLSKMSPRILGPVESIEPRNASILCALKLEISMCVDSSLSIQDRRSNLNERHFVEAKVCGVVATMCSTVEYILGDLRSSAFGGFRSGFGLGESYGWEVWLD